VVIGRRVAYSEKIRKKPVVCGLLFYKTMIACRSGKSNRKCNILWIKML
jgi:hypothetical protein